MFVHDLVKIKPKVCYSKSDRLYTKVVAVGRVLVSFSVLITVKQFKNLRIFFDSVNTKVAS